MGSTLEIDCGKASESLDASGERILAVPATVKVDGSVVASGEVFMYSAIDENGESDWALHDISSKLVEELKATFGKERFAMQSAVAADAYWACEEHAFDAEHGEGAYAERSNAALTALECARAASKVSDVAGNVETAFVHAQGMAIAEELQAVRAAFDRFKQMVAEECEFAMVELRPRTAMRPMAATVVSVRERVQRLYDESIKR